MNRKLILILLSLPWASPVRAAEPELKGTPSELSAYLSTVPGVVQLNAEGEVRTAPTALAATALPRGEEGFAGFGELIFKTTVTVEYTATNP